MAHCIKKPEPAQTKSMEEIHAEISQRVEEVEQQLGLEKGTVQLFAPLWEAADYTYCRFPKLDKPIFDMSAYGNHGVVENMNSED